MKKKINNRILTSLAVITVFTGSFLLSPFVAADIYQDQINQLQADNNSKEYQVDNLELEAQDLQSTIAALQDRINGLQTQINDNTARNQRLKAEIKEAEEELARQKNLLGKNIKAMYLEGEISTIEMLASSKDLSEFVDRQQYRNAVKDKITQTLASINDLKVQLNTQKQQVEALLKEQQALQGQVVAQRSEQNRLLNLNESQQSELDGEIQANFDEIKDLKRQQAIQNARLFGGTSVGEIGGGGYPWGLATCASTGRVDGFCASYDWRSNGSSTPWNWSTGGYAYRNCTDWVSYRVRSTGGYVPAGLGNAKTWDNRAPAYGFSTSVTPQAGAAAVSNYGYYGHVMYVEAVNADGSILVSDYNKGGVGKYNLVTMQYAGPGKYKNSNNGSISYLNFVLF